eukprot:NODE_735_length_4708_cov_0.180122.p2 type:complete len:317 gc:universal NODE_735_length_4708_cov_0.180122:1930-980(-)
MEQRLIDQQIFFEWLIDSGSSLSKKIDFCDFEEEGRGLVALEDIEEGEELFYIPWDCCIIGDSSDQSLSSEHKWLPLMIKLFHESRSDTYAPYLTMIPQVDLPMIWSEDEQQLVEAILPIGLEDAQILYEKLCEYVDCSFEEFNYIGCAIMAYSFSFSDIIMIPLADMLNHSSYHNAQLYEVDEDSPMQGFAMRATKRITAGEQIFNTYGELGNVDLLMKYGFVEPNNPYEQKWLDEYLGLEYYEEENNLDDIDLEADLDKVQYDANADVQEYIDALDGILDADFLSARIQKLQYIAATHKDLLSDWLGSGNTIEE